MSLRARRTALAIAALVCSLGAVRPARADNGMKALAEGAAAVAVGSEILIPEVRFVVGADDHRWLLSWTVVPTTVRLVHTDLIGLSLQPFFEPQYAPGRDALRFVVGGRTLLYRPRGALIQISPLLEAAALAGSDGSGGFAGAGIAAGNAELGIALAAVGRAVWTIDGERRGDFALDLTLPLTCSQC